MNWTQETETAIKHLICCLGKTDRIAPVDQEKVVYSCFVSHRFQKGDFCISLPSSDPDQGVSHV